MGAFSYQECNEMWSSRSFLLRRVVTESGNGFQPITIAEQSILFVTLRIMWRWQLKFICQLHCVWLPYIPNGICCNQVDVLHQFQAVAEQVVMWFGTFRQICHEVGSNSTLNQSHIIRVHQVLSTLFTLMKTWMSSDTQKNPWAIFSQKTSPLLGVTRIPHRFYLGRHGLCDHPLQLKISSLQHPCH